MVVFTIVDMRGPPFMPYTPALGRWSRWNRCLSPVCSPCDMGHRPGPTPNLALTLLQVARPHARDLGLAFQLTNMLRDIGEDIDLDRQYIPVEVSVRVRASDRQYSTVHAISVQMSLGDLTIGSTPVSYWDRHAL